MLIRDIRKHTGLTQKEFAKLYNIPLPTLRHWEQGVSKAPVYYVDLLKKITHYSDDDTIIIKRHNAAYYYYKNTSTVSNVYGDCVHITKDLSDVKPHNLALYLDDLFNDINISKEKFFLSCEQDKGSDILWEKA